MFEYKLVPAPEKSTKHKGLKGAALFAATVQDLLNSLGAEGWHYLRAETLPEAVRSGLASHRIVERKLLIFQRPLPQAKDMEPAARTALSPPDRIEEPSLAKLFLDPGTRTQPPRD